jgi:hypothetical protein
VSRTDANSGTSTLEDGLGKARHKRDSVANGLVLKCLGALPRSLPRSCLVRTKSDIDALYQP